MMGAGKTTVGRQLAKRLGKTFYDADREIEARTGVRVAVIFDIEGEAGFRKRESEVIERLTALNDVVLATGGGAVLDPRNRDNLRTRGFVMYLHALPPALYAVRDPLYRDVADLVIETGRQGIGSLLAQVLARFDEACKLSA